MPGVGEERDRIADHAEAGFDQDEGGVERDADGESPTKACGRVDVSMIVLMMVVIGMIVVMMRVIVVFGHWTGPAELKLTDPKPSSD